MNNKRNERPIFEIREDIDPGGYARQEELARKQTTVPQILNVTLKEARCLRDKIQPGYFVMKVKVLSRIGGEELAHDLEEVTEDFKELS